MNNYVDIGINLTNKQFKNDYDEVINRALDNGVEQMILTGTSVRGSQESAEIAEEYPDILYSTAGIHPHDAKSFTNESIALLKELLRLPHVVSVGDTMAFLLALLLSPTSVSFALALLYKV